MSRLYSDSSNAAVLDDPGTGQLDDVLVVTEQAGRELAALGVDAVQTNGSLWKGSWAAPRWAVVLWGQGAFAEPGGPEAAQRAQRDREFRAALVASLALGGAKAARRLVEAKLGA